MDKKINDIQENAAINMKKCVHSFVKSANKIHIGRVSPNMLDSIIVEYYGTVTPISALTNSVVEDFRTLVVTVFDPSTIKLVEKAILTSNLGLMPIIQGNLIRIRLPVLTEDRRRTLIKMIRSESEKSKISVRNIRRICNDKVKSLLKCKEIDEDSEFHFQNEIQKLTDFWIKKIDLAFKKRELELMQF